MAREQRQEIIQELQDQVHTLESLLEEKTVNWRCVWILFTETSSSVLQYYEVDMTPRVRIAAVLPSFYGGNGRCWPHRMSFSQQEVSTPHYSSVPAGTSHSSQSNQ